VVGDAFHAAQHFGMIQRRPQSGVVKAGCQPDQGTQAINTGISAGIGIEA